MVDPDSLRRYVFPGTKALIDQAKSYGLTVVHHSCGSIHPIVDDLFQLGVDAIHPIQAKAKDMNAEKLKADFAGHGCFFGGVDAQHLLVNGTPEQVAADVRRLKALFPTGLILSPSHEAILPDINPANVEALFKAVHEGTAPEPSTQDTMKRFGQVIAVQPGQIEEYKRLHANAWPGVLKMIKECNLQNYSIYFKDGYLFSYYEYVGTDYEADMAKMAADPETQRWWAVCKPLQKPLDTRAEGEWWADMEEVFHLD